MEGGIGVYNIRNRKTEEKIIQNRQKIRPKPKTSLTLKIQSRPQSSSLSRMTEGEKSSGEPWNRRLSHWFSRGTKNTHMIGSFKS